MSGNAPPPNKKTDRRILRTRERLGDALVELLLEKPFDGITVQDVLDRAGVARSTFYEHFRDKDDLFLSDVDDFLGMMASSLSRSNEASDRVAPIREMFEHIAQQRELYAALVASGRLHDFLDLARGHFARAIEQRLSELPRAHGMTAPQRAAASQSLAGSMFSLLTWWIDRGAPGSASDMDDLFHRMVWSGVVAGNAAT